MKEQKTYPLSVLDELDEPCEFVQGTTLRDYFAAQALAALSQGFTYNSYENAAKAAYKLADAMLKERNK